MKNYSYNLDKLSRFLASLREWDFLNKKSQLQDEVRTFFEQESGRWDLNPRPQRPERCALARLRYSPKPMNYKLIKAVCPASAVVNHIVISHNFLFNQALIFLSKFWFKIKFFK